MKTGIKKAFLTALAVLAVGCARAGKTIPASPVLATVDGVPITLPQFKERLRLLRFDEISGSAPSEDAKIDLLSQMIQEEMYLHEAGRLKISATPAEVDERLRKVSSGYGPSFGGTLKDEGITPDEFRKGAQRDITVEKLLSSQVYSRVVVTREQAAAYVKENKKKLWNDKQVRVRQIVVESRAEARELLRVIKRGADFAQLASRRSLSPDAAQGGDLGWVKKDTMPPAFESAIWKLKTGKTSGIIKTSYGYHIFKAEAIRKAGPPTPGEAEAAAVKELSREMREERFQAWLSQLKARTKVQVNYSLLREI
ncbi:MAG: peptidylprolyl isomerase [Nitrospirota bacterium]